LLPLDVIRYCIDPYLGFECGSLRDNTLNRFRVHNFVVTGRDVHATKCTTSGFDSIMFLKDNQLAVVRRQSLYVFDMDTDALVSSVLMHVPPTMSDSWTFRPWSSTPDNHILCSCKSHALEFSVDGKLAHMVHLDCSAYINNMHRSPDGRIFGIGSRTGRIRGHSARDGKKLCKSDGEAVSFIVPAFQQGLVFATDRKAYGWVRAYSAANLQELYVFSVSIIRRMRQYDAIHMATDCDGNLSLIVKPGKTGACFVHTKDGHHMRRIEAVDMGPLGVSTTPFEIGHTSTSGVDVRGHLWISNDAAVHFLQSVENGYLINLSYGEFY
jgi:hypothetical protein